MSLPAKRSRPLASRLGVVLCGIAIVAALLILAPTLTRGLWIARLALRETSLLTTAVALVGLAVIGSGGGPALRAIRILAVGAAVVGLMPFNAQWRVLRRAGLSFSIREYVVGPARPEVRTDWDVVLDARNPPLRADVWHAPDPGPHPFVLSIHGGSWRAGEKGQGVHTFRALAAAGYTVIDADYRLAPAHPFPEGIGDVKCVLGRLRERAGEFQIDPQRGALLGRSAGGEMVLVAAYSTGDARVPPSCDVSDAPVQAVIATYAPVDLIWGHANPMRPDILQTTESLELYLGGPPVRRLETYQLASPTSWLDHPVPRTLLLHGASDLIVESLHATLLESQLRARGQEVALLVVPFGEHGFDMRPGGVGEQLARQAILRFLKPL
jgi:acetyl esterase/lipase